MEGKGDTQRRLVIYRTDDGPEAALYPLEANAFSPPDWVFPLSAHQPLPEEEPGSIVTISGPVRAGAVPTIHAGDVEIVPARGLSRYAMHGDRIFAEKGDVIAHPHAIGWETSWRHVASPSTSPLQQWESRMRTMFWAAVLSLALLVGWIGFAVWRAINGDSVRGPGIYTSLTFGGVIASGVYAYRARRAIRRARRLVDRQPHPMTMQIWWAAGGPGGPMAMAALFPPDADATTPPVSHVPVVNVPVGLRTSEPVAVEVRGDPDDAPVIVYGDEELWPANQPYEVNA